MVQQVGRDQVRYRFVALLVLAVLSAVAYGLITWLSPSFEFDTPQRQRPIIAVLLLFAFSFGLYIAAIRIARSLPSGTHEPSAKHTLWVIVGAGVLFRATMFFSVPIQEVDVYRYIWDGLVCSQGISPFRYTPDQIKSATKESAGDTALGRLVRLRESDPAIAEVLHRVHFSELPTIYPATSQAVFCAATMSTPRKASLVTRLRFMKLWLLGFDLATLYLVIRLLQVCRMSVGLCVVYAWCPLVMKEIANSGHLDAIAVFFCMLAVLHLVSTATHDKLGTRTTIDLTLAAFALALAVGAKLYPVVLVPMACFVVLRRYGWRYAVIPGAVFTGMTVAALWPMTPTSTQPISSEQIHLESDSPFVELVETTTSNLDETPPTTESTDPSLGLGAFLKHWEMNDFIFMVIVENLKPSATFPENASVWFSVVPDPIRSAIVDPVTRWLHKSADNVPFLITRAATALCFVLLAIWWAWRASGQGDARVVCNYAFLTLAWFWLLCPTQNPWYWLWVLPLLPFAQSRAWLAMSGLVMVYYLRFWFEYHADTAVLGTDYIGTAFFDFVVTWLEFAPWFIYLGITYLSRKCQTEPQQLRLKL